MYSSHIYIRTCYEILMAYNLDNPWLFSFFSNFFINYKKQEGPMSFTLPGVFTIAIAVTVGAVISVYKVISVIKCLVFTTIIVISLMCLYTLQSKRDFTKLGTFLMTGLIVLLGAEKRKHRDFLEKW
ncbi:Protein lifeguard 4 [Armadillidium nasatum]|uniref:Protein lifeguard 4 n=1 Tax=Armadillidium nasatum TaxID=96803 RepID=A0A5N5T7Z8_9CRUS|nr:Protein lifeguard 4 [Armadillidium nasatum]